MGEEPSGSLRRPPHFFFEKTFRTPHHAKLRMKLPTQDQGENLEDLHQKECQRSAQQCAANVVLGENLETSMITTSARNWNVHVLLGSLLLQRGIRHDSRHFHQLSAYVASPQRCGVLSWEILGTSMTCLGGQSVQPLQELHPTCGTGTSRICTKGKTSMMCSTVCR